MDRCFFNVYHFLYVENNCAKKEKAFVSQVGREAMGRHIRQGQQEKPWKVCYGVFLYVSTFKP